jgi:hypothetical protein
MCWFLFNVIGTFSGGMFEVGIDNVLLEPIRIAVRTYQGDERFISASAGDRMSFFLERWLFRITS